MPVDSAERAVLRWSLRESEQLRQGLVVLATVACVAPLTGVLGAIFGILFDCFPRGGGELTAVMAFVAGGMAWACVPVALGLLVGLVSRWAYLHLDGQASVLQRESALEGLRLLRLLPRQAGAGGPSETALPWLEDYAGEGAAEDRSRRGAAVPALLIVLGTLLAQAVWNWSGSGQPLAAAVTQAWWRVLFVLAVSHLPAYAVWVNLLHRRRSAVVLPAALICLAWCVAGMAWPGWGG